MVSLLILKALYNLSDEELVEQQWEMNPYFQYFGGIDILRWGQPCAATDLVHFRKRIGEEGIEKILRHSIDLHGKDAQDKHVSVDTTVQEKNITYPTDAKLHKKIADKCVSIAQQEGLKLRRSYVRTTKKLVRELEKKLPHQQRAETLALFNKVLAQEQHSKNKIYSLHEPDVYCVAKGKAHKKYEYGCKGSDQVNFAMAASGFNYRKLMKKLRAIALWLYTKLVSNRKSQLELKSFIQFGLISPPKMSC